MLEGIQSVLMQIIWQTKCLLNGFELFDRKGFPIGFEFAFILEVIMVVQDEAVAIEGADY